MSSSTPSNDNPPPEHQRDSSERTGHLPADGAVQDESAQSNLDKLRADCAAARELLDQQQPADFTRLRQAYLQLRLRAACERFDRPKISPIRRHLTLSNAAITVVIGLAGFVIYAYLNKAHEANVQVHATADCVRMTLHEETGLILQHPVEALSIRGSGAVEYSPPQGSRQTYEPNTPFDINPIGSSIVWLDTIIVPAHSTLTLWTSPDWRIEISRTPSAKRLPSVTWRQVNGSQIQIDPEASDPDPNTYSSPSLRTVDERIGTLASLEAIGDHDSKLIISFDPPTDIASNSLDPNRVVPLEWTIDALAGVAADVPTFIRPETVQAGKNLLSSLRSGQVYLTGYEREPATLQELEHLSIEHADDGHALLVSMRSAGIRVLWEGTANKIEAGHPPHMRPMMPSKLEAALPNPQARLAIGIVIYAMLFVLSLRRVSIPDQPDVPL